jgi:hypothetical protein
MIKFALRHFARLLACLLLVMPLAARAGPPFITDDPEPTTLHHWEIYAYAGGSHESAGRSLDTGLDLNYGGFKDVQLTAVLPLHTETGAPLDTGDVQMAAKFKLIHQDGGFLPLDVTFFPRAFLPTGRGSTRAQILLPVWVAHEAGRWQFFGGGGYTLNPGPEQRNYWVQGAAALRQMRAGWQLGIEEYHQGATAQGERAVTGLNLGTLIHIRGPVSLIGSAGQALNRRQSVFYVALKFDL